MLTRVKREAGSRKDSNKTWIFLYRFSKNSQLWIITKIGPVAAELFYVDGRTDRQGDRHDEAKVRVRHFANAPIKLEGLKEVREGAFYMQYLSRTVINWE